MRDCIRTKKLFQTVFAGRPELSETLDLLSLERLKQDAILSCTLEPFTAQETKDYIEFRLAQAGMAGQTVFPPSAIAEIYGRSRGFAPAIHAVCEALLRAAFSARSKVCTQDVLDQLFGYPRVEQPTHIDIAPSVVAVTGIDLGHLIAPPEPEPPAILTTLLHLIFTAVPSFPPPLPLKASQILDAQPIAPRTALPAGKFVIPVNLFPIGSKQPIPLLFDAASRVPPPLPASTNEQLERLAVKVATVWPTQKFMLPALALGSGAKEAMRPGKAIAGAARIDLPVQTTSAGGFMSMPKVSRPAASAEPRSEGKLRRIRPNRVARVAPSALVSAAAIDFSSTALQPSLSKLADLAASTAILMPKGVNRLVRLSSTVKPSAGTMRRREAQAGSPPIEVSPATLHPAANFQPAGEERVSMVPLPTRPQPPVVSTEFRNAVPSAVEFAGPDTCHPNGPAGRSAASQLGESALVSLTYDLTPAHATGNVPGGASSIPSAPVLAPMQPEAKLEPAGTVWRPRVPMTPFGAAPSDPPPARVPGDIQFESPNLGKPLAPAIAGLTASPERSLREQNHRVPVACNVSPVAPPAGTLASALWSVLPSLRPMRPSSNLEPVDPRRSFSLLSTPEAGPSIEKPVSVQWKWLAAFAIPMLAGLTLYGLSPMLRNAARTVSQGWERAHQAMSRGRRLRWMKISAPAWTIGPAAEALARRGLPTLPVLCNPGHSLCIALHSG